MNRCRDASWAPHDHDQDRCGHDRRARGGGEWREEAAPYPPELAEVVEWLKPCMDWHAARASEEERRPHRSTIPALVISGEFDPTSHPVVGEEQLRWLPNGYHVIIPGMGHRPAARSAAMMRDSTLALVRRPGESLWPAEPA